MSFFFSPLAVSRVARLRFLSLSLSLLSQSKVTRHQVRPARLEQLEHLVQRRHVQDVLHPVGIIASAARAALQRDDRADLDLVVGVDEDQVFRVEDPDDVLSVALPDRDAGVAYCIGFVWRCFFSYQGRVFGGGGGGGKEGRKEEERRKLSKKKKKKKIFSPDL